MAHAHARPALVLCQVEAPFAVQAGRDGEHEVERHPLHLQLHVPGPGTRDGSRPPQGRQHHRGPGRLQPPARRPVPRASQQAGRDGEQVSKKSEFAETGLKAALAAFQFGFFDRDRNGTVESVDICRAFANIEDANGNPAVKPEEAHAIATAIMEDADTDNSSCGALDFSEFMTCIEGDGIAFGDFLKKLKTRETLEDYQDCLASYKAQREVVDKEKASAVKRKSFSERHPSMAAQMKEDSLKPGARRASALGQEASGPIRRSLFKQSSSKAGETAVDPASASTEPASRV
eukprot:scaffold20659_cov64-Phaeocystis_antarctica.AAC.1